MWTSHLKYCFISLVIGVGMINTATVERIYIKDNKVPVKGITLEIVCEVLHFDSGVVQIMKSNTTSQSNSNAYVLKTCDSTKCIGGVINRHTFSTNSRGVTVTVTDLTRTDDQKYWICVEPKSKKEIHITVHTITQTLTYENPPSQPQDLVENSLILKCITGCAYPSPSFKWYYRKTEGSHQEWSTTAVVTEKAGSCTDSEKIYTSTLSLKRYTVFSDNTDTTVKFQCGAVSATGAVDNHFTQNSVNVRFAVRVSTVTLNDGDSIPSNLLEVDSGEPHTLTCTASESRPPSTIIWYFGSQLQKRENTTKSSFTFTPVYSDNQKNLYCKAFNIMPENQAVSSYEVSLYVKVKVTTVTLKDNNKIPPTTVEVTIGVSRTFTCTARESRPTATIIWHIGNDVKKMENVTISTLTFTPVISDHNKQVYCRASQSGNPDVFSNRISLYVKVSSTTPTIKDLTPEKLEGDQIRYQCTSSLTRPVTVVTWKLNTQELKNVRNTEHDHENYFKSVTSIVTLTTNRTDNNKTIYCETAIPGQSDLAKAQEKLTVYWPPSSPVISTSNFPFLEGQTGKSIYCSSSDYGNPTATATWTTQVGIPDSGDTRNLLLPQLTYKVNGSPVKCQLKNLFTDKKDVTLQSSQIYFQVEYSPRVQIIVEGKLVNTTTTNEGQALSVTCNATGNPNPVVNWQEQQTSGSILLFNDIDRTDHGTYSCRAAAKSTNYPSHNFVTKQEVAVIVNYAPDVTVDVSNQSPTENESLTVKCKPEGRPSDYNVTSFIHKWGSAVIPSKPYTPSGVITIKNVQLQDSGTYICEANNGVKDRNQRLDQSGNKTVKIKVSPKLLLKEHERIFAGAPDIAFNITVPFYCDPSPKAVQFKFLNDSVIGNSSKHTVTFFRGNVEDTFYGKEVELEGYFAQLQINNEEESDFINYTLVINNGIGSSKSWVLEHVSQSKPSIPRFFNFTGFLNGLPHFHLEGNFNGGLAQRFVVETSEVGKENWVKQLEFNETDRAFLQAKKLTFSFNISGLQPNTYDVRVLAGNDVGWIKEADAPTVRLTIVKTGGTPSPSPVAAIAGGIAGASFVIILAVVLVFVWKKRSKSKDDRSNVLKKRHRANSDSSEENVMTENLAYVSADEVGRGSDMGANQDYLYAQPNKTSKCAEGKDYLYASAQKGKNEDQSKIYALPNKKEKKNQKKDVKKQKTEKGGKTSKDKKGGRKDDVYENASELTQIQRKMYAGEENVYENPEQSKSTPKVNRNKDGLIYADLAFNDQPKGQKKLVIHGLDDRTEYVEVDFTKKAEPLPDSDEEDSTPKK